VLEAMKCCEFFIRETQMKLVYLAILIALFVWGVGVALARTNLNSSNRSNDEALIRRIDALWSKAADDKDLEGAVHPYAEDASILPFGAPIATGTDAIRNTWAALMAKPGYSLTFVPTKIEVASAGDMAWEIGTFELRLNNAQGQPMDIPGKYVVTWRKIGPTWKVAADIFNTDK
jgi:ketosteroid isomerase-like protein